MFEVTNQRRILLQSTTSTQAKKKRYVRHGSRARPKNKGLKLAVAFRGNLRVRHIIEAGLPPERLLRLGRFVIWPILGTHGYITDAPRTELTTLHTGAQGSLH